jgi:hypothetical protein
MRYEEIELNWSITGEPLEEEEKMGLDEVELSRLAYFAEHPELADPVIWFLPESRRIRHEKRH